ncbi:MAG: hypothetical protein QOJ59_5274 [Thermomicrobiales bacterium]|jgi:hypothetical protein|nr:hypothetical protein [Thermomicrobiales bacterium]
MITARQLARAYDLSVASLWRGDAPDQSLIAWLARYRVTDPLPEPQTTPEAVSLLGGGGSGIRWYSTPTAVVGFATGHPAVCYRIPIGSELPTAGDTTVCEPLMPVDLVAASM